MKHTFSDGALCAAAKNKIMKYIDAMFGVG